ncbi:MAG: glycosyltransferase, partial [Saprospiraceae bacterium]
MLTALTFLFWFGLFTVFYAYLGYALFLLVLLRLRKKRLDTPIGIPFGPEWPEVTFVVCAFNEAKWIEHKITNSLALDYPRDRVYFVFVTDGSDDATPDLVKSYPYPADVRW